MKTYILRFFAVIGIVATVFCGLLAWGIVALVNHASTPDPTPESIVLTLDLTRPVVEKADSLNSAIGSFLGEHEDTPLLPLLRAIARAKKDPHVKGLVARFGTYQPDLATAQELRDALASFRESGKPTLAWGASYGDFTGGNKAYYLASAFDEIWLQPVGSVGLNSLGADVPFFRGSLDWLGVTPDFIQREEYKSLMEHATNKAFSAPVRANMESLLRNVEAQEAHGIAAGRKMPEDKAASLFAKGPFTAQEALDNGLVTRLAYQDEVDDEIKKKMGDKAEAMAPLVYLDSEKDEEKPHKSGGKEAKAVALIVADGMIVDNASGPLSLDEENIVDTDSLVEAFEDAAKDDEVKAILFRVNSPGGSPAASETIRRALIKAKESKKPVYVSMGSVAASGGYWISMNADKIWAQPGTITGSIGVIGGKFADGGLGAKLGITWDKVSTSPDADMLSLSKPFTPAQRARMEAMMDGTYAAFRKNVAESRKIPAEKLDDITKGRVFTGQQAKDLGLVDELGGIAATLKAIKKEIGVKEGETVELRELPEAKTPAMEIYKTIKRLGAEQALSGFGPLGKQAAALSFLLSTTKAPVQARMPDPYLQVIR